MLKRILMVGTYPIINPQHGGQKRTKAIYQAYLDARVGEVKYASVIVGEHHLIRGRDDVSVSLETQDKINLFPHLSDIICGNAIIEDEKVKIAFTKIINKFKPTIIEVEQVYAYMGLKQLLKEIGYTGKIINSSQNVEWQMKNEMYQLSDMEPQVIKRALKDIKATEKELAQNASLNVAVSKDDATYMQKNYEIADVVLAPNGMNHLVTNERFLERWKKHFDASQIDHIVVFVGSGHIPNMTGFMHMVGSKIGFLPRNSRIIIVGGVADLIWSRLKDNAVEDVCFRQRVELLGRRSEEDLAALISLADTIILPITQGGGSNLKTAEALLSGKNIIATKHAFRGYEEYHNAPGVYIAESPEIFRAKILKSFEKNTPMSYPARVAESEGVLWKNTLSTLVLRVKAL
jgi:hypothetical protein